jgi:hypothetical protein
LATPLTGPAGLAGPLLTWLPSVVRPFQLKLWRRGSRGRSCGRTGFFRSVVIQMFGRCLRQLTPLSFGRQSTSLVRHLGGCDLSAQARCGWAEGDRRALADGGCEKSQATLSQRLSSLSDLPVQRRSLCARLLPGRSDKRALKAEYSGTFWNADKLMECRLEAGGVNRPCAAPAAEPARPGSKNAVASYGAHFILDPLLMNASWWRKSL